MGIGDWVGRGFKLNKMLEISPASCSLGNELRVLLVDW